MCFVMIVYAKHIIIECAEKPIQDLRITYAKIKTHIKVKYM